LIIKITAMTIELKKFGTMLVSRQAGRESFSALQPQLRDVPESETIDIDFDGVLTFSPSWGDEFLTPLGKTYGERIRLRHVNNPSVLATLELLQKTTGIVFRVRE
jgi:hypothetical protein